MPNSRIDYLYRDGSNYKQDGSVVLAGELTDEQRALILEHAEAFLPDQVGLPVLYEAWSSHYEDDHPWHEITAIETVSSKPTHPESAADLAERFRDIEWDATAAEAALQAWAATVPRGS